MPVPVAVGVDGGDEPVVGFPHPRRVADPGAGNQHKPGALHRAGPC
jgi:hypothetical protein